MAQKTRNLGIVYNLDKLFAEGFPEGLKVGKKLQHLKRYGFSFTITKWAEVLAVTDRTISGWKRTPPSTRTEKGRHALEQRFKRKLLELGLPNDRNLGHLCRWIFYDESPQGNGLPADRGSGSVQHREVEISSCADLRKRVAPEDEDSDAHRDAAPRMDSTYTDLVKARLVELALQRASKWTLVLSRLSDLRTMLYSLHPDVTWDTEWKRDGDVFWRDHNKQMLLSSLCQNSDELLSAREILQDIWRDIDEYADISGGPENELRSNITARVDELEELLDETEHLDGVTDQLEKTLGGAR